MGAGFRLRQRFAVTSRSAAENRHDRGLSGSHRRGRQVRANIDIQVGRVEREGLLSAHHPRQLTERLLTLN
jgi:hypothetical protein